MLRSSSKDVGEFLRQPARESVAGARAALEAVLEPKRDDARNPVVGTRPEANRAHLIEPIGGASPLRIAQSPAMVVVLTAPRPTSSTPSLPFGGAT